MTGPAQRQRYNVGVVKLPHADRDVARDILGATGEGRGFYDILGADTADDDPMFPVGADCTYAVELTEAEAERFAAASNCRYIVPDDVIALPCIPANVPAHASRTWIGQTFNGNEYWHGRNVNVAVLDLGTSPAMRSYMGYTLVGRSWADTSDPPPASTVYTSAHNHGCFSTSAAVPAGGRLLDFVVARRDATSSPSFIAAGIRWACDQGARVINISFSSGLDRDRSQPVADAINYMGNFDCVIFAAAGNDSMNAIVYPAAFAFTYSHVHAVMSFSEPNNRLASDTNYTTDSRAGVAPGDPILGVTSSAQEANWRGTSAASPFAASCAVRIISGGGVTARQASTALKQNLRPLGLPYQGGGGYSMQRAITGLGINPAGLIARRGAWMAAMW